MKPADGGSGGHRMNSRPPARRDSPNLSVLGEDLNETGNKQDFLAFDPGSCMFAALLLSRVELQFRDTAGAGNFRQPAQTDGLPSLCSQLHLLLQLSKTFSFIFVIKFLSSHCEVALCVELAAAHGTQDDLHS